MKKENQKVSLETMTGIGQKIKIAGREYLILPVNIRDMHYVLNNEIIIVDKKKIEEGEVSWQVFGLNYTEDERKKAFLDIISKYVFYSINGEYIPMSEELLIEHNWSFKEIGEFLFAWVQISD